MAAKKRLPKVRRGKQSEPAPAPQLVDIGRSVAVTVKKSSAEEIVLSLSDGTVLRLRPVVMGIERSLEKFNPAGDPVYQFNVGLMMATSVPRKLKTKRKMK